MDATLAYKNACRNAISFLEKQGYTAEQAYIILGTVPIEGRISGIVDIPNALCTVALPKAVFTFELKPKGELLSK
jgi:formamidase